MSDETRNEIREGDETTFWNLIIDARDAAIESGKVDIWDTVLNAMGISYNSGVLCGCKRKIPK